MQAIKYIFVVNLLDILCTQVVKELLIIFIDSSLSSCVVVLDYFWRENYIAFRIWDTSGPTECLVFRKATTFLSFFGGMCSFLSGTLLFDLVLFSGLEAWHVLLIHLCCPVNICLVCNSCVSALESLFNCPMSRISLCLAEDS